MIILLGSNVTEKKMKKVRIFLKFKSIHTVYLNPNLHTKKKNILTFKAFRGISFPSPSKYNFQNSMFVLFDTRRQNSKRKLQLMHYFPFLNYDGTSFILENKKRNIYNKMFIQ